LSAEMQWDKAMCKW